MLKSCRAAVKPVPAGCHYQTHHRGFIWFTTKISGTVLELELFSACHLLSSSLWQYRVRPLSHCTQDLVLFLYPGLQGKASVNISFSHKAPVRQGLQISLNRTTAPTRRLFALPSSHVTFLWVQPSLSTFSPSKARALYLLSIFPWLCGFHSWLQLSAALSAHIIWETNTKQVVLEAPSHFCQPFPNNNS